MGSINVVTHNLQGIFSNRQLGIVHTSRSYHIRKNAPYDKRSDPGLC